MCYTSVHMVDRCLDFQLLRSLDSLQEPLKQPQFNSVVSL